VWYPALTKAGLRRRIMYQTRHTFASNALAAVSASVGSRGSPDGEREGKARQGRVLNPLGS